MVLCAGEMDLEGPFATSVVNWREIQQQPGGMVPLKEITEGFVFP